MDIIKGFQIDLKYLRRLHLNIIANIKQVMDDKEAISIEEVVKLIQQEVFTMVKEYKGMIIEHFYSHLVLNYKNCRIPSCNLSRFFDIGLSMKNALSG